MKIDNDVSNVLGNSVVDNNKVYLPKGQLERGLYLRVDKVLKAINGKWDRKEKAHVFTESPSDIIDEILLTGEYTDKKKEYQFFETPSEIANKLIEMAKIGKEETVLEPSAGKGAIAKYINGCDCIELNKENREYLIENKYNLVWDNFLTFSKKYDVIIANPPFSKQQDITHVEHMISLVNRRVVSIMSFGVLFRTNKKTINFREKIKQLNGTFISLPDESFNKSGTNVKTCVLCVDK